MGKKDKVRDDEPRDGSEDENAASAGGKKLKTKFYEEELGKLQI